MQQQFDRLNETGSLKSYITHHGKDAQGKQILPRVEFVDRDEVTGLIKEAPFKSILLEADLQGKYYIKTEFFLLQRTETGYSPDSANSVLTHYTEEAEAQQFVNNLFGLIDKSVLNAVAIKLGHNTNRFFAPDGTPQNEPAHQQKPNDKAIENAPVQ